MGQIEKLPYIPKPPSPKTRPNKPQAYAQATEIQSYLLQDCRNEKVTATARAQSARAFLELERLKREIRMKPKPKPVDVALVQKSSRKVSPFAEPADAPPAKPASTPPERAAKEKAPEGVAQRSEQPLAGDDQTR